MSTTVYALYYNRDEDIQHKDILVGRTKCEFSQGYYRPKFGTVSNIVAVGLYE